MEWRLWFTAYEEGKQGFLKEKENMMLETSLLRIPENNLGSETVNRKHGQRQCATQCFIVPVVHAWSYENSDKY